MDRVGGAVGKGGAVIPDGPGTSQEVGRCVPVTRWERMQILRILTVHHEYKTPHALNQIWLSIGV